MTRELSRPAVPAETAPGLGTAVPTPRRGVVGDRLTVAPSQPRAGVLLVRVLGGLDDDTAPRCARVLHGAVDAVAAEAALRHVEARVICDVTAVDVLGAAGLEALVAADAHARRRDVTLEVVVGEGAVAQRVRGTGVDERLRTVAHLVGTDVPSAPGTEPRTDPDARTDADVTVRDRP